MVSSLFEEEDSHEEQDTLKQVHTFSISQL